MRGGRAVLCLNECAWDVLLPWKCASQTLRTRLLPHASEPYGQLFYFNPVLGRVASQHHGFADYLTLAAQRPPRRVAAFVRNPYDRVVSGFLQLCRDARVIPQLPFADRELRAFVLAQVAQNTQELIQAGYDVNQWFLRLPAYRMLDRGSATFLLQPAHYWTHHLGRRVDFIGRVETFEPCFDRLLAALGLGPVERVSSNTTPGPAAPASPQGYRYLSRLHPNTIARIHEVFAADFDRLGYPRVSG